MIVDRASKIAVNLSNSLRIAGLAAFCLAVAFSTSGVAQGGGRQVLSGHLSSAMAGSRAVRQMERSADLSLSISLPLRNEAQLDALLAQIADPTSPNYHHYLTPEQFAAEYAPTESDYQTMITFAQENGLTVTKIPSNRMILNVSGAVGDVEKAFHVQMTRFSHPTRGEYFSADREPSVDADVRIAHVGGLSNFSLPHPMNMKVQPEVNALVNGSAPGGGLIGSDYRAAYAPNVTLTGAGQSVALVEFDGFFAGDVGKNFAKANLPPVPVNTVLVDGIDGTAGYNNVEVILDIMMAAYMAPGLSNVSVYEGYWPEDVLNQIATDNTAKQISSSWSFDVNTTTEQIFKQFQAQGQSFLQASGDIGGYTDGVYPPCDDPNITVVGATSLSTAGAGGPWSAESPWNSSGGGVSTTYPIPSYQQNINLTAAVGSSTMRNIPDVAMVGAGQIYLIANNGGAMTVAGTSASAPLWAGFTALVNQQAVANAKPTVGFLNPAIYAIGNSGNYSQDFHDIRTGNNGAFKSIAGFDLVSGWGTPTGQPLIDDLTDAFAGTFTITASQSSLTLFATVNGFKGAVGFASSGAPAGVTLTVAGSGSSNTLTFTASSGAAPGSYTIKLYATSGRFTATTSINLSIPSPTFSLSTSATALTALVGGTNVISTISVQGQNNFSSSVALTVSGLPVGMTSTFSAASTKTSSVLTFKPTSATVPGAYFVTVTGTAPTDTQSAVITLIVPTPSFTLTSSASSLTVLVGGTRVANTITVSNPIGLSGRVNLTLSGVPAGVTAVLGAPSTVASSSLTLTPSTTLAPGTYPITVKGTTGVVASSTVVTLFVPAPSFSLTPSTSSLTALVGGTKVANTITVSNPIGLGGKVNLTLSGVPAGVTAVLGAPITAASSSLTFTPSATLAPGTYPITVNGTTGVVGSSTVVTLVVPAPSFSLTPSTSSLTALVGGSRVANTITVSNPVGLSGKVNLTLSGVPAGVTAVLSAPSTTALSSLTFTPSATLAPGSYPITVKGISGVATDSTVVTLVVPVPSFSLLAAMPSVSSGPTVAVTINIANPVGLSGNVNLGFSGVPAGIKATFSASSTLTSSKLTFTAIANAVPGNYAVTVLGTAVGAASSTVVTLTVPSSGNKLSAAVDSPNR